MRLLVLVLVLVGLGACGGAALQNVHIVNKTTRAIEKLTVCDSSCAEHGSLAPNGSTQLQAHAGHVEFRALSAKLKVDEHTRDQPSASQVIELTGPIEVVFYDEGQKPAEVDQPGVFGIAFVLPKGKDSATMPPSEVPDQPAPENP